MSRHFNTVRLLFAITAAGLFWFGSRETLSAWQRNMGVLGLMGDLADNQPLFLLETAQGKLELAARNGDKRAQFWLGYLYAYQGKVREAQRAYVDSKDLAYWLVLHGRNLYDSDPEGSIKIYERAMALYAEYSAAYFFAGQSYQRLQNYEQAVKLYVHALETGEFDPRLSSDEGARHHRAGYASIERTYQRLGESYIALRDWGSATQAVERLLEMEPNRAEGYYLGGQISYLRVVYNQSIDPNSTLRDAENSLRAAVNIDTRHFWAHIFLGRVYGQMGKPHEAQAEFEIAVSIDPNDPSGRLELGRTYLTLGQVDEAVYHLEIAQKLAPSWPSVWVSLGDAYAAQGKIELASQAYQEALQRDPTYEPAKRRLSGMEGR